MYQLNKSTHLIFDLPQQLIIAKEANRFDIIMLFLQSQNKWYQIYLDVGVLFITQILLDNYQQNLDEYLEDLSQTYNLL